MNKQKDYYRILKIDRADHFSLNIFDDQGKVIILC